MRDNTIQDPSNNNSNILSFANSSTNGDVLVDSNTFTNANSNNTDKMFQVSCRGTSVMNVTITNNVADGTVADQFNFGVFLTMNNTPRVVLNVSDNLFNNFDSSGISFLSANFASLTGTISGNTVSNVSDQDCIRARANNGTMNISNNVLTNAGDDAIQLFGDPEGVTYVISNNNITNATNDGIKFEDPPAGPTKIALRNNTITSFGNSFSADQTGGTQDICFDITGNTADRGMVFDNDGSATWSVERREANEGGPLDANGVNDIPDGIRYGDGTINSVAAGFCQIP